MTNTEEATVYPAQPTGALLKAWVLIGQWRVASAGWRGGISPPNGIRVLLNVPWAIGPTSRIKSIAQHSHTSLVSPLYRQGQAGCWRKRLSLKNKVYGGEYFCHSQLKPAEDLSENLAAGFRTQSRVQIQWHDYSSFWVRPSNPSSQTSRTTVHQVSAGSDSDLHVDRRQLVILTRRTTVRATSKSSAM